MLPVEAVGAKPPSCQSTPTWPNEADPISLIVGDVVNLESAGVDVAQYQVGGLGGADGSDARKLPIHPNCADEAAPVVWLLSMSRTCNSPVLLLRNKRSLSPETPLKLPTPENCQSGPTVPIKAEP